MRLLLSIAALSLSTAASPTRLEPVHYTLAPEMSGDELTGLRIQVSFRADPSGVTDFRWDDGWSGERRLWQWTRDLKVAGAAAVERRDGGHWRIRAAPGANLTVSYRVVSAYDHDPTVEDTEQARPVVRPRWFYAAGNALFGFPGGREAVPATFDWIGTPGIGFASDLEHLAGRSRSALRSGTIADALESIVIGGRDLQTFSAHDGSGVRVATIGRYAFTPEQLNALARQVIAVERDFWRTDRRAPFLVTAAPIVGDPTVMSMGGTGRGDAFALWVDQRTPLDRMKWLLAHEYFHTWNSARLGTMPQDRKTRPAHYWFSEGFTDYYARALMVRAGLISPADFAAQWNEMLAAYAGSPVRTLSGPQAASAFWENDAAQKLAYQRGALLAAIWNRKLLEASGGRVNLDTVMHAQLATARTSGEYATDLFRQMANRNGLDIAADEARYLEGGEPILLPADTFGACATIDTEQRPSFSRGFDAEATAAAGNIVTGVDPRLPAYSAGLRDGMKIVERTEGETDNANVAYGLRVEDDGLKRIIRYLPQGLSRVSVQEVKINQLNDRQCRKTLSGMAGGTSP